MLAQRGDLAVERDRLRPSGRLLRQGDMDASYIDLADPRHLEFDYLRWMREVLRAARARRVVHVGGAACALARALVAEDPAGRQQVCEIDADVLAMAREHMGLRRMPGLRVRAVDGRAFLAAEPSRRWDAVVIDAFIGAAVPRRLITREAFAELAAVAPLALVNVVDDRTAREVQLIAAGLHGVFAQVCALSGRSGNTVVVGSRRHLDLDRIATRAAADVSPARLIAPAELEALSAGMSGLADAALPPAPTAPRDG